LQNARAESTLLGVTWQVGRSGKLTPVAEIEPVILAGAEVRRATINNISWISEIGLKLGSRIMVVRSGDVIPQITEVLDI
jgi:DNA ligase (NAD+)